MNSGDASSDEELICRLARPILEAAELAEIGISVSVVDGASIRRVYVSDVAARILGYPREELIDRSTLISFSPEEAERMADLSRRFVRGESIPHVVESEVIAKNGEHRPVEIAYSAVVLDGKSATVSFVRDITERKRTLAALEKSERLFRRLVERAPEAVSLVSHERFVYANPCFLELLGYDSLSELEGVDPSTIIGVDGREHAITTKDGRVLSVESSSLAIELGGSPGVVSFLRDVTARKEAHTQLVVRDRMATVGTLAAAVAHELNNPLAYVMLNLDALEKEIGATERTAETLRLLREGTRQMASVVNDLRTFCKPEEPPRPVEPRAVLESALDMAKHELDAASRTSVVRDYAPVPLVLADSTRLGQVFLNVLVNAAQAMAEVPRERHELRIALRPLCEGRVEIAISDTGTGIPRDIIDRIFDPFFTTKPTGVGTGLGLAISRSIVFAMKGGITVESVVGQGSRFVIVLPALTS